MTTPFPRPPHLQKHRYKVCRKAKQRGKKWYWLWDVPKVSLVHTMGCTFGLCCLSLQFSPGSHFPSPSSSQLIHPQAQRLMITTSLSLGQMSSPTPDSCHQLVTEVLHVDNSLTPKTQLFPPELLHFLLKLFLLLFLLPLPLSLPLPSFSEGSHSQWKAWTTHPTA